MIYLAIILIVLVVGFYWAEKHQRHFMSSLFHDGYGMSFFCGIATILICIALFTGSIIYFCSINDVAEMEAFYNEVCTTYEKTVEKSEDITINAVERAEKQFSEILDTGNLAYFELAKAVNTNLQDLRNEMKDYNNTLYSYRKYNNNWFTDTFLCDVPEYLKPIKMK